MVFRTTPQLGPGLHDVHGAPAYFDAQGATDVSPQLGTVEKGSDGSEYVWVKASANISATQTTGTEVDLNTSTWTIATKQGAGGYFTPPNKAVAQGEFTWARKG